MAAFNTLAIKKFQVNPSMIDRVDYPIVDLEGRSSGFVAFILNVLALNDTTSLKCYKNRLEYKTASLFGESSLTIPLNKITGVVGGFSEPIELLIAAFLLFLLGIISGGGFQNGWIFFIVGILIPVILMVQYLFNKTLSLVVSNGGNNLYGLQFKKALIEGTEVDIRLVKDAIWWINEAVLRAG
jgi:hypothetical protein